MNQDEQQNIDQKKKESTLSENFTGSKNARGDEQYDSENLESELITPAKRKRNKIQRVMQLDGSNEKPSDLGLKNLSDAAKLDSEKNSAGEAGSEASSLQEDHRPATIYFHSIHETAKLKLEKLKKIEDDQMVDLKNNLEVGSPVYVKRVEDPNFEPDGENLTDTRPLDEIPNSAILFNRAECLKIFADELKLTGNLLDGYLKNQEKVQYNRNFQQGDNKVFCVINTGEKLPSNVTMMDMFYTPVALDEESLLDFSQTTLLGGEQFRKGIEQKAQSEFINKVIGECCTEKKFPIFTDNEPRLNNELRSIYPHIKYTNNNFDVLTSVWEQTQPATLGILKLSSDFYKENWDTQIQHLQEVIPYFFSPAIRKTQAFKDFIQNPILISQILALVVYGMKAVCGCRAHYHVDTRSFFKGVAHYLKFQNVRTHMDVEWARHYTLSEFELENVKGQIAYDDIKKAAYIQAKINRPKSSPQAQPAGDYQFRQNSNSWTPHHTSFCQSILEPDAAKHCILSAAFHEATHSHDPIHMIDFGLPHASSWLFLAAAKTKLFNDAKTTSPAIASFTGYNSIELEHLEGVTLGTYGSFMGRDKECYNWFNVPSNISKGSRVQKPEKRDYVLKLLGERKISSVRGEYFLRKLNSHDFEKVKTENREIEFTIWKQTTLGLLEIIQNLGNKFHKAIVQLRFMKDPTVVRVDPPVVDQKSGHKFEQPGANEVYNVTGNIAFDVE